METSMVPQPRLGSMRTFYTIWLGQLISMLGSGLTSFALGVWIFQRTGQATPFAITVLFATLPQILVAPLAGALVDRWNRRAVMLLADTGSALATFGAFLLLSFGSLEIWHIYILAAFNSFFQGFQGPAYSAAITMLVPKKELARASGRVQVGHGLQTLVAPVLAGVLFVSIGLQGVFLIDFATFFFAITTLLAVHVPQPADMAAEKGAKRSLRQDILFGWNYLRLRVGLFGLLLYFAMVNFFLNFAGVLLPPMVLSFASADTLGFVQGVGGAGMLLGSLAISAWGGPPRRIAAVIAFISATGLGFLVLGSRPWPLLMGAGLWLVYFAVPIASSLAQAVFQSKVAPQVQGRVFAIRSMISRSVMPLAFLIAGPLADRVFEPLLLEDGALAGSPLAGLLGVGPGRGIALLFILCGSFVLLASALAYAHPRIRRVEEELPDVLPDEPVEQALTMEEGIGIEAYQSISPASD